MNLPVPISPDFLTKGQLDKLSNIAPSLMHAYHVRQMWRTETEMRVSVLNDLNHPTPASKYWQAVREQCVFLEQLAQLSFDFRRNIVKAARAQKILEQSIDDCDIEEQQIILDECAWAESNMRLAAEDRIREILLWEQLKNEQIAADPTFDRNDVNGHQPVSYTVHFIKRVVNTDTSQLTGGELDNLLGQLTTSIRYARESGILPQVMQHLDPAAQNVLKQMAPTLLETH